MALTKVTDTPATKYTTTYGGAVYLSINNTKLMLTAADIRTPRFSYVAPSFYEAVTVGKIADAITAVANKITGMPSDTESAMSTKIKSLTNIPVLGEILTADLKITEFVVEPETIAGAADAKYSFGFGLEFNSEIALGPIKLDGVSFTVKLQQTKDAK